MILVYRILKLEMYTSQTWNVIHAVWCFDCSQLTKPFSTVRWSIILTLLVMQTKTYTFANSTDLLETARNEPSHQDLHYLPFFLLLILNDTPICNSGHVRIQSWKSPLQNLRGERVNALLIPNYFTFQSWQGSWYSMRLPWTDFRITRC